METNISNNEISSNNSINENKSSFFIILFFKYAFLGVKALFFDIWVIIFNLLSFYLDSAYKKTKSSLGANSFNDDEYDRIKGSGNKKEKKYNYSINTLKKLEAEKAFLMEDLKTSGATREKEPHTYYFKVRDENGKIITGTMSGYSKLDINAFLLNEGYDVYVIKTSKWIEFIYNDSFVSKSAMSTKDLIFLLTQLSTYLKAGLTLNDSIRILALQMKKKKNRSRAFQSISYELMLGESFSNALEKQGNMFPALLINMIKAAEATGTLQETLEDMSNYYTDINDTHREMINAITYPIVILCFSLAVVIFIIVYVVPKFEDIYAQSGAKITGMTAVLINISNFLSTSWINLILGIVIFVLLNIVMYHKIKSFRTELQIFAMHLPLFNKIIIYNELTIFAKTFASLLRNNVFITDSMSILSKITNNEVYKAILYRTINNIIKGEKISEAFKDHWAVPDVAYYMIVTGESTGRLADMMQKVSDYYQAEHKSLVENLKSFIEPILITILAVVVGVIIISVIVPMFEIYNTIQ
jgi:type IV pilus assembly protein PilC